MFDKQNLNARQARWLAFLSEYDFEIKHIKGKENKVEDALSRHANLIYTVTRSNYETNLEERVRITAEKDPEYQNIKLKIVDNSTGIEESDFRFSKSGLLMYKNRLYVPESNEIKLLILDELHKKPYSGHPGYQKLITMLRKEFYWPNMKGETTEYLARCLECQQVKVEHQHPTGLLQPLPIPEWKWEVISMDFITGLPRSSKQNDSIMVVVDKLSKETHFIPVKSTYKAINIA
jgi:hypothetical protein